MFLLTKFNIETETAVEVWDKGVTVAFGDTKLELEADFETVVLALELALTLELVGEAVAFEVGVLV